MGRRVHFFDSIESTQGYAVDLAAGGGELGSVVIAREQTGGRGRLGRKWASPPGGVWMSVVLCPDLDADVVTLLPAAASVALSVAMDGVLGIKTGIKWPNDILVEGGKAAGIIIDADIESGKIRSLVLGAGINLNVSAGLIEDIDWGGQRTQKGGKRAGHVCRCPRKAHPEVSSGAGGSSTDVAGGQDRTSGSCLDRALVHHRGGGVCRSTPRHGRPPRP